MQVESKTKIDNRENKDNKEKTKEKEEKTKEKAKEQVKEQIKEQTNKEKDDDDTDLGVDTGAKIIMTGKIRGKKIDTGIKAKGDDSGKVQESARTKSNINLKDLEAIKTNIHEISLNANPIGKLIDYLPEDIESMNKELHYWVSESKGYKDKLEDEIKKSEEILLPLENEYIELDETIKDEILRIKSIKSRILKNEIVIQNLINGVISVKNI